MCVLGFQGANIWSHAIWCVVVVVVVVVVQTEEDEDGDETPQLDLDPSLEWEVDTDVFPLLSSTHPAAQRLGAYYLALVHTHQSPS